MFATSQDILNLALAIGFSLIALFLSIALFYAIFVLRDLSQATTAIRSAASKVNNVIVQPLKVLKSIFEHSKDIAAFVEKYAGKKNCKK
jgi:predicted permease